MRKNFLIEGNICGHRIRLARVNRRLEQKDLAREINFLGMEMTPLIISRIENNQRHVCDAELLMFSKVLKYSMEWLCGEGDDLPK